jgi:hypothetical protein
MKAVESHTLPGMESTVAQQKHAAAVQQAEDLGAAMRQPKADVSGKAGEMEREAPLFFGTGDNPSLF